MEKQWWIIDLFVHGSLRRLGRVEATRQEIIDALGPYVEIRGNGVKVYGRPRHAG